MILIGQYLSPFTRRVAVALQAYGIDYRHEIWSAFADFERIVQFNPAGRVPVLVLDSGEALIESAAILDYLDQLAGADRALIAVGGEERRSTLRVCALATALCEKLIAIIYEQRNHEAVSESWIHRCEAQIGGILIALEKERAGHATPFWFGQRLTHADIAVTCATTFLRAVNPQLAARAVQPALSDHIDRCEQLAIFKAAAPILPQPAK